MLLAGEPSGDHHGAALARALKERMPGVRLTGLGGPRMRAEGVRTLAGLEDLAVMGFAEVVRRLRFFRRLEGNLKKHLQEEGVDLVIPIDYPGFNMRATRHGHALGIPVLYYIAPQIWAWRVGRARSLAETTRHVAVILPFEVELLERAGAEVTFVGHPLLERPDEVDSDEVFRRRWNLDPERPILALLPGSRAQEVERHLSPFIGAARILQKGQPDLQPVIARGDSVPMKQYGEVPFPMVDDSRGVLRHARGALVKSGTSTLEAALEGVPFVMAYRTSRITWEIARRVIQVEHVALANLVANGRVVPELLQDDVRPDALAGALEPLLHEGEPRRAQLTGLAGVRTALGGPGASGRVADLAVRILERAE